MGASQLNRGQPRRVMYVENKEGLLEGARAWIGWVTFSKTGRTIFYKARSFRATGGQGIRGNFRDEETGEEYWISGVKVRGTNAHAAEGTVKPIIDEDAKEEYARIRLAV
jgi:hypothetical protein